MHSGRKTFRFGKSLRTAALLALVSAPVMAADAPPVCHDSVADAEFRQPTSRYPHGALGDDAEWGAMSVTYRLKLPCRAGYGGKTLTLPDELVFEDVAPRLWDVTGDGKPEIVVVESHQNKGARLAVWGIGAHGFARIGATEFIGKRFRWLAPVGAADFNRDGYPDLAYIETPHLTGGLRIVTLKGNRLVEIAGATGLTNHRIGDAVISGGLRDCGQGPEMVLAGFPWRGAGEMLAVEVSFPELQVIAWPFKQPFQPDTVAAALSCKIHPDRF